MNDAVVFLFGKEEGGVGLFDFSSLSTRYTCHRRKPLFLFLDNETICKLK